MFRATSVDANISGGGVGDPYVDPLFVNGRGFNSRIDTNRYRILTFEFGVPDKPRDILNGSIARIVWRVNGESAENVSDDIIFNSRSGANVLNKVIVDMADRRQPLARTRFPQRLDQWVDQQAGARHLPRRPARIRRADRLLHQAHQAGGARKDERVVHDSLDLQQTERHGRPVLGR